MRVCKCAVNSVNLDELIPQGVSLSSAFTWGSIVCKYKDHPPSLEFVNLYRFAANHLLGSRTIAVPEFFGFSKHIMWPPHEDFSKWMLGIYKPWHETVDELKVNGSFVDGLLSYMWHEDFLAMISVALLHCKLKWTFNGSVTHGMAVDDRGQGEGLSMASNLQYSPHDMATADSE